MPHRSGCYSPRAASPAAPGRILGVRAGVTLIEMLVAVALTLLVVLAIVRVFDILGGNVTESRAILELSGELRNASNLLQADLDRVTAPTLPPLDERAGLGYLEIVEGIRTDWDNDGDRLAGGDFLAALNPVDVDFTDPDLIFQPAFRQNIALLLGDTDDVLLATIRSRDKPFTGRFQDRIVESELAEVVWWIDLPLPGDPPATVLTIHRRVLLIRPDLNLLLENLQFATPDELRIFLANNDLSVRPAGNRLIANSLGDLTRRACRFAHWDPTIAQAPDFVVDGFPFPLNRFFLVPASDRSDLVLGDALAFDLRVYDPTAALLSVAGQPPYSLTPTDPGFYRLASQAPVADGRGAYVDLAYGQGAFPLNSPLQSRFSLLPHPKSQLERLLGGAPRVDLPRVYCTWSSHYESDGIPQDGMPVDQGTNGFDDNGGVPNVVDDRMEQETSPPYPAPLRGVEILLRAQEYSTRQVRQTSVIGDFLPE